MRAGEASADGLSHPVWPSRLTGAGRGEDVGVTDAKLEAEEAGGGGDAAVPGVGLLYRVAVLQGVNAHPGLIWWRDYDSSERKRRFYSTASCSLNLIKYDQTCLA